MLLRDERRSSGSHSPGSRSLLVTARWLSLCQRPLPTNETAPAVDSLMCAGAQAKIEVQHAGGAQAVGRVQQQRTARQALPMSNGSSSTEARWAAASMRSERASSPRRRKSCLLSRLIRHAASSITLPTSSQAAASLPMSSTCLGGLAPIEKRDSGTGERAHPLSVH